MVLGDKYTAKTNSKEFINITENEKLRKFTLKSQKPIINKAHITYRRGHKGMKIIVQPKDL